MGLTKAGIKKLLSKSWNIGNVLYTLRDHGNKAVARAEDAKRRLGEHCAFPDSEKVWVSTRTRQGQEARSQNEDDKYNAHSTTAKHLA
jgi:hypothetical protein